MERNEHNCVLTVPQSVFFYLENEHLLNPLDELQLWCLHKVYIPRINWPLEVFRQQMNNPPTLRFILTPLQEDEVRQVIESTNVDDFGIISQYLSVVQLLQTWDHAQ